jgi:hypothetical protein
VLGGERDAEATSWAIYIQISPYTSEIVAAHPEFPLELVRDLSGLFIAADSNVDDIDPYRDAFHTAAHHVAKLVPKIVT